MMTTKKTPHMPDEARTEVSDRPASGTAAGRGRYCCYISILILFIMMLFAVRIPAYLEGRRVFWMSRAKVTLRHLGEAMNAYHEASDERTYGSFQALKESGFIDPDQSLDDVAEMYFLTWDFSNVSTVSNEDFPASTVGTYQIIAYPQDTRTGYLHTFAITEDQVVRVYNPEEGNELDDVKTWDPIL
jgi:hypothetical protein